MRRRSIPVDGCNLSVVEDGSGLPLVFVHGVVTTSHVFTEHLGAFSPQYRGIAVDLCGYGESDKPGRGYTIDQFAADLIRVADYLGLERAVWLGVSMGGMILQRLCLDYPDRVAALVLVSTTDEAMILDNEIHTIGSSRAYRTVSEAIIDGSFASGTDSRFPQRLKEKIPTWNADVIRQALQSMSRFNVHGQLHRITAPTLILVGSEDASTTPTIAKRIQVQIQGSKLAVFERSGHFMMLEYPDRFRAVLHEFLQGLPNK